MKLLILLLMVGISKSYDFSEATDRPHPFPGIGLPFENDAFLSGLYLPIDAKTQEPIPHLLQSPSEPSVEYLPPMAHRLPNNYPRFLDRYTSSNVNDEQNPSESEEHAIFSTPSQNIMKMNSNLFNYNGSYSSMVQIKPAEKKDKDTRLNNAETTPNNNFERKHYHQTTSTSMPYLNYPRSSTNNVPRDSPELNKNRRTIMQHPPNNIQHTMPGPVSDQYQTASSDSLHFVPGQSANLQNDGVQSVPILRQSSEMDLDGSFSYETLTGDQTHIVQQGHIENLGTDHEEQVIQGSYSFLSDDGQTYTVHYVADSNGFRATGDHLPRAPPMPEIIQRSIQYNLAEEANKSHQDSERFYHNSENNILKNQLPRRNIPPTKQPENFSQYLAAAGSNQNPTSIPSPSNDVNLYQSHAVISPRMSPQVNYAASHGAYMPNNVQPSSISRSIKVDELPKQYEKQEPQSHLAPQTSNNIFQNRRIYTRVPAETKEEYLMNMNSNNMNSLSRSSVESEDEVLINFNDLSSQQYDQIYHTKITPPSSEDEIYKQGKVLEDKQSLNSGTQENFKNKQRTSYSQFDLNKYKNQSPIIIGKTFLPLSQNIRTSYDYTPHDDTLSPYFPVKNTYESDPSNVKHYVKDDGTYVPQIKHIITVNKTLTNNISDKAREKQNQLYDTATAGINNIFSSKNDGEIEQNNINSLNSSFYNNNPKTEQKFFKPSIEANHNLKENLKLADTSSHNLDKYSKPKDDISKMVTDVKKISKYFFNPYDYYQDDSYPSIQGLIDPIDDIDSSPMDLEQLINFIGMRNYFESTKIKPKSSEKSQVYNKNLKKQSAVRENVIEYSPDDSKNIIPKNNQYSNNGNIFNRDQKNLAGSQNQIGKKSKLSRNYTVLKRNPIPSSNNKDNYALDSFIKTAYQPPALNLWTKDEDKWPYQDLPPLGRAGPSLKTYLPPQVPMYS